jgi:hypothetical protein
MWVFLNKIKLGTWIILSLVILLLSWIVLLQTRLYHYPKQDELTRRVNYLQRIINEPLKPGYSIIALGNENYEWMLFSYSFSSYAITTNAIHDSSYRNQFNTFISVPYLFVAKLRYELFRLRLSKKYE